MRGPLEGAEAAAAATLTRDRAATGVFCDFDGTLADIVDDPADARPAAGAVDALAALAAAMGRVAVISGRPGRFLAEHLGGTGAVLAGLYGLERVVGGQVEVASAARNWEPVVAEVAGRARRRGIDGLRVEPKGVVVTFHYRAAPGAGHAVGALAEEEAAATGLEASPGRLSWELRPPLPTTKGSVVASMAAGLTAACFLGDDHGDLSAFDALDTLAAGGVATVRVAVESDESPPALLDRADLVLPDPAAVVRLLRRLSP
ncbi:MAG: trehalose-phosphatase [Acidimicrobiales bacterium]